MGKNENIVTNANKSGHEKRNVPTLRFPNYNGEWCASPMDKVCTFHKGYGISKENLSSEGVPCVLYGELYTTYKTAIAKHIRSKTKLDPTTLFHSERNDVIIPCSGETAEDIATSVCIPYDDVLLGGDLTVIRSELDGAFLSNQINSVRKYDIARVAQGKSIVHLQADELKKITIAYPSKEEQQKIACFIDKLDDRIECQNKIIEDLKILKKELNSFLISRLTNGKEPNCKIEDVIDYEQPTSYIVNSDKYIVDGETPVLTANKAFFLGYTNEKDGIYDKSDCIIFDDFTLDFKYVDFPFKVKSSAIKILKAKRFIELRYFYEYLLFLNLTTNEHKRHYISEIATLPLYLPSIKEQERVLNVLNAISSKITVEEKYKTALQAQKKHLLNAMFI